MRSIWTIAAREILSFFVSPIAYVVLTVWLVLQGLTLYMFAVYFATQPYITGAVTETPLTMFFGRSSLFYMGLLVVVPLLTMRLLAAEQRNGTIEPLLTAPVTELQVVLGKYLAAMVFWLVLWLPSVLYVLILGNYGHVDPGVVATSYLGVFCIGLYYMAIGLLMSAVSSSQIVAATLTFMMVMVLFLLGVGEMVFDGTPKEVFGYLSIWGHMEDFSKGIVDSRHIVVSLSLTVLPLFLAVRVLQGRRYS